MPTNMSPLYEEIMAALMEATEQGLNEITAAAKDKAPVRRIFQSPSKRKTLGPEHIGVRSGANRRGLLGVLNTSKGPAFQWPQKQGRLVFDLGGDVSRVRGTRAKLVSTATKTEAGTVFGEGHTVQIGGSVRGRPNGLRQVINTKELGKIGGTLNALSESGQLSHELITGFRHGNPARVNLNTHLTSRGRYELKTGRAVTVNKEGDEQIGGKLVEGIKSTGVQRHGDQIYGYVEAYASDEGRNFNYAWAQEMGTGHNRPQPFLRPALREQHERIIGSQKNVLRKAFEGFSRRPGGQIAFGQLEINFKGTKGISQFGKYLDQLARQGVE